MTLQERLAFCKICTNRKMNPQIGLVCGLTNEKPAFIDTCADFNKDEAEAERTLALKMNAAGNVETSKGTNPKQNKTIGIIILSVGLLVTIGSFIINFGTYVIIAYGTVVYGISRIIKGIHQERILKANELLNEKISKINKEN